MPSGAACCSTYAKALLPRRGSRCRADTAMVSIQRSSVPLKDLARTASGDITYRPVNRYTHVRARTKRMWVPLSTCYALVAARFPDNLSNKSAEATRTCAAVVVYELSKPSRLTSMSGTQWPRLRLQARPRSFWGTPIYSALAYCCARLRRAPHSRFPSIYVFGHGTPSFNSDRRRTPNARLRARSPTQLQTLQFYRPERARLSTLRRSATSRSTTRAYAVNSAKTSWGDSITRD